VDEVIRVDSIRLRDFFIIILTDGR